MSNAINESGRTVVIMRKDWWACHKIINEECDPIKDKEKIELLLHRATRIKRQILLRELEEKLYALADQYRIAVQAPNRSIAAIESIAFAMRTVEEDIRRFGKNQ